MKLINLLKSLEAEIADQFEALESFPGAGEIEIKYGFRTVLYFDFFINEKIELTSYSCNQMMMTNEGWVDDPTADDDLITVMEKSFYLLLRERYNELEEKAAEAFIKPITPDEAILGIGFASVADSYKQ
ncbi:MAG: hypothetical protein BWX63_02366 [Bacteroidetes bacterium ADurb.Bin041]|nr:MAG: hypothetical protein BWX63_02366 [Bacteroidetes bacterium ADurb.Bin041]